MQAALPPSAPPHIDGLTIGSSFGSATEMAGLGGDLYDVIDLGGEGALVLVGDVSGKGLEAAGAAAQAWYAITALVDKASDPAVFMCDHLVLAIRVDSFSTDPACRARSSAVRRRPVSLPAVQVLRCSRVKYNEAITEGISPRSR